ncbi:hypothetical protein C4573_04180 [Candidatus Woesearchaeota archaeon]|nr:MAG: hypothetical protein C4573_04180 [Candidatus Woesearchaeota archaeon]
MKRGLVVFLALLLFPLVSAVDFNDFGVLPPSVPASSLDTYAIRLFLKDTANKNVSNVHIIIQIEAADKKTESLRYVSNDVITLELEPGNYTIILKADSLTTNGGDYYYRGTLEVFADMNQTINFLPVGSIRGSVSKKNLIEGADVKFICSKSYGDLEEIKTDKFGSFVNDYLPTGNCKILARDGEDIGNVDVVVEQGMVKNVEVTLNEKGSASSELFLFITIGIVIFILLFFWITKKPKEEKINKRANDLMQTLNETEQKIVSFLMEHKEAYQNKIVYGVNIPKTTLTRVLMSLERKKIIQVEKVGKTKKVRLTEWFLNKEKKPN